MLISCSSGQPLRVPWDLGERMRVLKCQGNSSLASSPHELYALAGPTCSSPDTQSYLFAIYGVL